MGKTTKHLSKAKKMILDRNKRYKVWFNRGSIFDTLDMATKYANLIQSRTGLIVAITKVR